MQVPFSCQPTMSSQAPKSQVANFEPHPGQEVSKSTKARRLPTPCAGLPSLMSATG